MPQQGTNRSKTARGKRAGKTVDKSARADPLEKDEDVEDMYALFNVSDGSLAPRLELQWRLIS